METTADMLSGAQTFMGSDGTRAYADPIPYGVNNNADDQGWIWMNDSHLDLNLALPAAVVQFRVWSVYALDPRGATWAVEYSDDRVTWTQATEFLYATRAGGGVNDDGSARGDAAGWYQVSFNENRTAHRYWRVRQTGVPGYEHAPRSGRVEFYAYSGPAERPFVRLALPVGRSVKASAPLLIQLQDGPTAVAAGSVQLSLNGEPVTPTVSKPADTNVTTIRYVPATGLPKTTNAVRLVFSDIATPPVSQTNEYSFVVVSDQEWAAQIAARARIEAQAVNAAGAGPEHVSGSTDIRVEPKSIPSIPAELMEMQLVLAAERNDFQGGAREPLMLPELTLKRADGFKTRFTPAPDLKPGFYSVRCRNRVGAEGSQASGSECRFAFVIKPPTLGAEPVGPEAAGSAAGVALTSKVVSLDGQWQLAIDPENAGKQARWFDRGPIAEARAARVPGVVDEVFPGGYEGVMWYWKEFETAAPGAGERLLLRFGAADYLAEVWVNGTHAAYHEGGDTPFTADITPLVRTGDKNRLVVRVLNPGTKAVDGLTRNEVPQGYKNYGLAQWHWNPGGLWQSVELLRVPSVRVADIFSDARLRDGTIACQVTLVNATSEAEKVTLQYEVAPASGGTMVAADTRRVELPPGVSAVKTDLIVPAARAWSLNDPYLYRVTVRVVSAAGRHDNSVRFGFREFEFRDGYFRLNGKRIWLKSCHNSQHYPIGQHIPTDLEMLRREMLNLKAMGFNMVRLPWRAMHPLQLAVCDELGFLVYEEHYASWLMEYSPAHNERFDRSICETILGDRNHPSLAMRGLLNETPDGPRFRHAVETLPLVRALDPNRLVILSSGRWDPNPAIGSLSNPGSPEWNCLLGGEEPAGTAQSANAPSGPKMPGDIHHYCMRPTPQESITLLRTIGAKTKNIFLSEFGHGNQMDLFELARLCEQDGSAPGGVDDKLMHELLARFEGDFKRWGVDQIYATPSDLVKEGEQIGAELRGEDLDLVRSNPKIAGHSITAWSDEGYESQGIVTLFREPKRGMFDVFRDRFAPVHWCLFVNPLHVYRGAKVTVEAVLVNEDVLRPGNYPVKLRVMGPAGPVLEKAGTLVVPPVEGTAEPPLALPVFKEEITFDGPAGQYEVAVYFERGAAARAAHKLFVGDRDALPKPPKAVTVWESGDTLAKWLGTRGAEVKRFEPGQSPEQRELILVQGAGALGDASAYRALLTRVARGSTAIVLTPGALVDTKRQTRRHLRELDYLPWPEKVRIGNPPGGWEGHDKVLKRHPVFAGLPNGCLVDMTFYRDLISPDWFILPKSVDSLAEVIVPCFIIKGNYSSGAVMAAMPFGEGKIILSSFRLLENLGRHPAADRIVLNQLAFGSADLQKPLSSVPAAVSEQIERIGSPQ